MNSLYDAVLFDLDNTLLDFDHSESLALQNALQQFGLEYQDDCLAWFRSINAELWPRLGRFLTTQDIFFQRFDSLLKQTDSPEDIDPLEVNRRFLDALVEASVLVPNARSVCHQLAKKYPTGIITNGELWVQEARLSKVGLIDCFQFLIASSDVGLAKPDPRIFAIGVERFATISRERILYIGDHPRSDIAGARGAGLGTCWYNPKAETFPEDFSPDHVIRDWFEVFAFL